MTQETDFSFKLSLFGAGGVGKTSLTRRFISGSFQLDTKMTMGASIHVKYLEIEDKKVSLQIWDFGGEEQFRFLLPVYARGSSAGIFMFDTTRFESIVNVEEWVEFFLQGLSEEERDVPVLLVGGKIDLVEDRSVNNQHALKMKNKYNFMDYIECSAKTGENVEKIFQTMARRLMEISRQD